MKRRTQIKKWNKEIKSFKTILKRNKNYSHYNTFVSYEYYDKEFRWSDIYFVGTYEGRKRLFNCTIMSSLDYFDIEIDCLIDDHLDKLYPNRHDNIKFVKEDKSFDIEIFDEKLEDSIEEELIKFKEKLLASGKIFINSHVKAYSGYHYGVGLDIVTEEKMLTKEIILEYVEKVQNINVVGVEEEILLSNNSINYTSDELKNSDSINSRPLII